MSEKLEAGLGSGLEIETNTSSRILQDFIELGWPASTLPNYPNLPLSSEVDFGAMPDRTIRGVTLRTYITYENVRAADIGSQFFSFDVPVSVDVFVRDVKASAERREPTALVAIDTYLRDYISTNRLALRSKGINNMMVSDINYISEPPDDEQDVVWYHLVVTVRMYYHMRRVPA